MAAGTIVPVPITAPLVLVNCSAAGPAARLAAGSAASSRATTIIAQATRSPRRVILVLGMVCSFPRWSPMIHTHMVRRAAISNL